MNSNVCDIKIQLYTQDKNSSTRTHRMHITIDVSEVDHRIAASVIMLARTAMSYVDQESYRMGFTITYQLLRSLGDSVTESFRIENFEPSTRRGIRELVDNIKADLDKDVYLLDVPFVDDDVVWDRALLDSYEIPSDVDSIPQEIGSELEHAALSEVDYVEYMDRRSQYDYSS